MSSTLEITGKLVKVMDEVSGQGKNGTWTKREFVIETVGEQYPKKVCVSAWGDKADNLRNVKPGDEIKVSFNIESREYNERWYTDVRAWRIERVGGGVTEQQPYVQQSETAAPAGNFENFNNGPTDDLPF